MGALESKSKSKDVILTEEKINYLLQNTKFTRPQIEAWYDGFIVSFYELAYYLIALHCHFRIFKKDAPKGI